MQHPVGYVIRNGRAEMVDFLAVITSSYGWLKFFHTVLSGYVVAAFFVTGISAWHLLRKNHPAFYKKSFRMAAVFGLASSVLIFGIGDFHAAEVAKTQPTKLAAMEAVWESERGVPLYLIVLPDVKNERNAIEFIGIPKVTSYLAYRDFNAEVKGLKAFPVKDRPPVMEVFLSFRLMVMLGTLFLLLSAVAVYLSWKDRLEANPLFLRIMLYTIPLPYLAAQLGWIVAEVGRQPWIVYGVLRTSDAVSRQIEPIQVMTSLIGFGIFYSFLGVLDIYLLAKYARKGPEGESSFPAESTPMKEA
jgi:cytochrome d ubiquinol oxidase subunit I